MRLALVNSNRIKPPIAPIGLEYVAEAAHAAGHVVRVLDLCWEEDVEAATTGFVGGTTFDLIGITFRNTDDCSFATRDSFVAGLADLVKTIRAATQAPIVLGGVGFSVMPVEILQVAGADVGVWGDGEFAISALADCVASGADWREQAGRSPAQLPGLVWQSDGLWHRNPLSPHPLSELPPMGRAWVDNGRYFREGGQIGIETKRGCPGKCVYCADPIAKGRVARLRPPAAVVDELEALLGRGIDHFHTCDSEFNLPEHHAQAVCEEIVDRGLGDRLRWYAYCAPVPFSSETAVLMRRAGCVGINFGVDSGDAEMLKRLRRGFGPDDILEAVRLCVDQGITVMLDLLLGSPGESRESLANTIELMKGSGADQIGVALGVRIYPGTELCSRLERESATGGLVGGGDAVEPRFFMEPGVASCAGELIDGLIGADERFLFFDPSRPEKNYNYNANERLVEAIAAGYRGAYWDILRRYRPGSQQQRH
jgi:hypothetical protein